MLLKLADRGNYKWRESSFVVCTPCTEVLFHPTGNEIEPIVFPGTRFALSSSQAPVTNSMDALKDVTLICPQSLILEWRASSVGSKFSKPIEEMSKDELNSCLKCFYTSARKQDGSYYKATSLKSIRSALDRHLRLPPHNKQFSIVSDAAFSEANRVLCGFVKELKISGKIEGVMHRKVIRKEQLELLFNRGQLGPANSQDPAELLRTAWFYIGLYFGRRGLGDQRDLKASMLVLKKSPDGAEYFELNRQTSASFLQHGNAKDESDAGAMFSVVNSPRCPVMTLKNYLSRLNRNCDSLFQRPKDRKKQNFKTEDAFWYWPHPMGKFSLDKLMTEMSRNAGITPSITKQCLRATSLAILSSTSRLKEDAVEAEQCSKASDLSQSHEMKFHKSNLLSRFVAKEVVNPVPFPRPGPKFVGTMIEIEQLVPKENAQTSAIVLEVRQIPIIAQEESKKIDEKHEVKYVNQVPPLPGILVNATIGEPVKSKLIPLAPRSETKSLQFKMDAN